MEHRWTWLRPVQRTLGPRWDKQASATDVTVIFYVDGVEVLRKNIRSKTLGTDIDIDLTNAKTFTIQLDPLGDGSYTADLASAISSYSVMHASSSWPTA